LQGAVMIGWLVCGRNFGYSRQDCILASPRVNRNSLNLRVTAPKPALNPDDFGPIL
jgi:hypothetical protein